MYFNVFFDSNFSKCSYLYVLCPHIEYINIKIFFLSELISPNDILLGKISSCLNVTIYFTLFIVSASILYLTTSGTWISPQEQAL